MARVFLWARTNHRWKSVLPARQLMTPAILIVAFDRGETNRAYCFASWGPSRDSGFHSFINGREDEFCCVMRFRVISWIVLSRHRLDPRSHTKRHGKKSSGQSMAKHDAINCGEGARQNRLVSEGILFQGGYYVA